MSLPLRLTLAAAAVLLTGCGSGGTQESAEEAPMEEAPGRVELPGVVTSPSGGEVEPPPETAVLLYYWLPLHRYEEMNEDLFLLASLDETFLPLPVQPDHDTRNHAQRIVNGLEISLPVYLADPALMQWLDCGILPVCVLMGPDGTVRTETGFGAPARLLGLTPPPE